LARWRRTEARPSTWLAGLVLLAAAMLAGSGGWADEPPKLRFALHGEPVSTLDLAALHRAAKSGTVRVFEPYEEREVSFEAFPFERLLDAVYGEAWRGEVELLFTCRDGYQPTVPAQRVLEHEAWLAFDRPGAPGFSIAKRESGRLQRVSLAPFYLVWQNRDDPVLRREGDYGWPYQLVGVDVIRPDDRFPKMAPPDGAPAEVREGFLAFRRHCSHCHTVNGEGGSIGPELLGPTALVAARDPAWLRRWIDEPSQFLPNARMPALNPALPDRDATIDAIVMYLRAMAGEATQGGVGGRQ
jgi:mono/diheme cytochrome c family protein